MDIGDLDLSIRSYCCLKRAEIETVEQLKELSHDDLCRIRNLSQKCVNEIEQKLKNI